MLKEKSNKMRKKKYNKEEGRKNVIKAKWGPEKNLKKEQKKIITQLHIKLNLA